MVVGVGCGHVDEIPGTGGKDIHGLWRKKMNLAVMRSIL